MRSPTPRRCEFPRPLFSRIEAGAVVRIALAALAFRVVSALLALAINTAFPLDQPRQMTVFPEPSTFWDTFARYDSGWYEGIARNGYAYAAGGRSNIAYFPVYPMLMRYAGRLFGRYHAAFYFGGVVVSWTAYVLAMVALYYLARLDLDREQSERAVLLISIFPFAFFYGMIYSESTYLLFTVLAFFWFRTRWWILGGLAASIAIATRTPAIVMWPSLAWIAWRTAAPAGRDRLMAAVALLLAVTGFAWYSLYIYQQSGNPFEWASTLQRWNYKIGGPPWRAPLNLASVLMTHPYGYIAGTRMGLYDTLYGLTGLAFLASVPLVWLRFGAAYGLFVLLNLLVPLSSGVFEGVGRYCSVLFPVFLWLASRQWKFAGTVVLTGFAMLYTLALALFTTLHPLF
jgi:Mannosyltransferase (PIG-V)